MTSTVNLTLGTVGGMSRDDRIEVDGHDITRTVDSIDFHARVGELTTFTLRLVSPRSAPGPAVGFAGQARVLVDDDLRLTLLALGWTSPAGVEAAVRFWIPSHREFVDQFELLPASWRVLRVLEWPDDMSGRCLVEILDTAAPLEAEGLVLEPTIQRHADGTVTVMDYGLPKPAVDRSDEIEVSVSIGDHDLDDPQILTIVKNAGQRQAAERRRRTVGEPTYAGAGHRGDVLMHHWRFKTRALAADEANPVPTSENAQE